MKQLKITSNPLSGVKMVGKHCCIMATVKFVVLVPNDEYRLSPPAGIESYVLMY